MENIKKNNFFVRVGLSDTFRREFVKRGTVIINNKTCKWDFEHTRPKIRSCRKEDATNECCQQYCSALLHLIASCSALLHLIAGRNNVAPTTLLHPVFRNLLQPLSYTIPWRECSISFNWITVSAKKLTSYRSSRLRGNLLTAK